MTDSKREYMRRWREKNKTHIAKVRSAYHHATYSGEEREKKRQYQQEYYKKNKEKILEKMRQAAPRRKASRKYYEIKRNYGLEPSQFDAIKKQQNGCCAICGGTEDQFKKGLAVDHCHKSKKVRGLLCDRCNTGLGLFQDSPELLCEAISYLYASEETRVTMAGDESAITDESEDFSEGT